MSPFKQENPRQETSSREELASSLRALERAGESRVWLLLGLLLFALAALWFFNTRPTADDHPRLVDQQPVTSPREAGVLELAAEEPETADTVAAMIEERKRLDETVWREEVEAQHYEEFFVGLWDQLRAADDPIQVLENVSFESFEWGQPQKVSETDWQILVSECSGSQNRVDGAEFARQLQSLAEAGLRIVQTEWHHSRFEIGEADEARSTVSIRIDAVNEKDQTRYNVTGDILVHWAAKADATGTPRPKSIDASGVRITQRTGPVGFEQVKKIDSSELGVPLSVPSIIAYDLDGNGLSELLIPSANIVYRNRGDWKFEPLRLLTFPSNEEITASVVADFNGDGVVDLLCASAGFPTLYIADKDGSFSTQGIEVDAVGEGLVFPSVLTAGDVDADGDLDVWLAQYKPAYHFGQMPTPYYDANDGFPSFLLLNDGSGRFQDATAARGLDAKRHRRTYSGSLVDLDEDRDLDLVVASDYSGLDLYMNDGSGNFTDVTDGLGDDRHCFGMSLTFADFNLDQRLDFYMTGMASTTARRLERMGLGREGFAEHQEMRSLMGYGNRMYLAGVDGFQQAAFNDQVARTGWSWGSSSFDFDNDADFDIYVANGHRSNQTAKDYCTRFWTHDIYTASSQHDPKMVNFFQQVFTTEFLPISWNGFEHNCLLMNQAGTGFVKVDFLMGVAFEFDSRNVISDDFDGDGRRDLLVVGKAADEAFGSIHFIKNVMPTDNHWIGVHLREKESGGRSPLGARVSVEYAGGKQVACIVSGDSLYSQHPSTAHFGLGKTDSVDKIEVLWTDGSRTQLEHPKVDHYHQLGKD